MSLAPSKSTEELTVWFDMITPTKFLFAKNRQNNKEKINKRIVLTKINE